MTTFFYLTAIILIPPFALLAAALYFGGARIHREMEEIAEAFRHSPGLPDSVPPMRDQMNQAGLQGTPSRGHFGHAGNDPIAVPLR